MSFRVAVIGAGRMGKLHARVISQMPGTELVCVVDTKPGEAEAVAKSLNCQAFTDDTKAVSLVDAAIISVPTIHHIQAARPFVEAGKHVLIEKPLFNDVAPAEELIALARKTGATIHVGHTERFNPAVLAISKYSIRPKFIEAHRVSPFTFRSADVGVVLDMMIHDIDLVLMLAGSKVASLHAVGVNVLGKHEDICNARLIFENGCVANLTASRLAVKTERRMRIFSEEAYLSVDYARKLGTVIKKSKNLDLIQMARDMKLTDLVELAKTVDYTKLLNVEELVIQDSVEPLRLQAEAVRQSFETGVPPVVSADDGLAAVRVATSIMDCLRNYKWDGDKSTRHGMDIIRKDD